MKIPIKALDVLFVTAVIRVVPAQAQSPEDTAKGLDPLADVVEELLNAPDSEIPQGPIEDAECIAVIPSIKKVTVGFGRQYGQGAVVWGSSEGGPWGAPSMIALDGGLV